MIARTARFRPDPVTLSVYGGLFAGMMAGFMGGVAVAMHFDWGAAIRPVPEHPALEYCLPKAEASPLDFYLQLEAAKRRGPPVRL